MTLFSDEKIPENMPQTDTVPPTDDVEYPCVVCGKESGPYGGRGRKPVKCAEHRGKSATNVKTGTNATLARQAAEALCQVNGLLTFGLMLASMPATASAIANAEDGFREQAEAALITDAALCRSILRVGTKSGKLSLMLAYGMLGAAVVPVAIMELKEKAAAREEKARQEYDYEGETV